MAGLKPGDEVITPACTFSTTVAPLCQLGLRPVFCDVGERTFVPSVEQVLEKVTAFTKAIFIPNLAGSKPDWEMLRSHLAEIARADICLIEDSCDTMTHTPTSDISVISLLCESRSSRQAAAAGWLCATRSSRFSWDFLIEIGDAQAITWRIQANDLATVWMASHMILNFFTLSKDITSRQQK